MKKETIVSLGLAMFTMLFGAGNIVFPLMLGRTCGSQVWIALVGFVLTAVILPVIGFVATVLCDGDFRRLLHYLGAIPGAAMVFLIMLLVGPLCAIPRCILLSYGTLKPFIPSVGLFGFAFVASQVVFFCAYKPAMIVKIFGRVFGPLKLGLIGFLVYKCLAFQGITEPVMTTHPFIEGLIAGYETMDLLGALVITGLMAVSMPWIICAQDRVALRKVMRKAVAIGAIGGASLTLVYLGFGFSAARFSQMLATVNSDELLSVMAIHVLGQSGKFVAAAIVLITCLTTAIVLSAAVARYLEHALRYKNWAYNRYLLGTCLLAGAMSVIGFDALTHAVEPIVLILYPIVILLSLAVIALKLRVPAQGSKSEVGKVENFFGSSPHPHVQQRVAAACRAQGRAE